MGVHLRRQVRARLVRLLSGAAVFCLLVMALQATLGVWQAKVHLDAEIRRLEGEVKAQWELRQQLKTKEAYWATDAALLAEARLYGYGRPGERVVLLVPAGR